MQFYKDNLCSFVKTVQISKAGDALLFFFLNLFLQGEPGAAFENSYALQGNIKNNLE